MKKKLLSVLFVLLTILYSIIGALLVVDIQVLQFPESTISMDIISIDTDTLLIQTKLNITNPNPFALILKNLEVTTSNENQEIIATLVIDGGTIEAEQNKEFNQTLQIQFQNTTPKRLTSTLSGVAGVELFGILQKTIPLKITVITDIGDTLTSLSLPKIDATADLTDVTSQGVNCTIDIDAFNPNPFTLFMDDVTIQVITQNGEDVGQFMIHGDPLEPKTHNILQGSGFIPIKALDAITLTINLRTNVSIQAAGMVEQLPVSTEMIIKIPRIDEIFNQNLPTDALIKSDMKPTLQGLRNTIELDIINPNKIALKAKNITFSLFKVSRNVTEFIGECIVDESNVGAEATTKISTEIIIPYRKIFLNNGFRLLPDALMVIVRAHLTVEGLDQWFWIGVSGYTDIRIFT